MPHGIWLDGIGEWSVVGYRWCALLWRGGCKLEPSCISKLDISIYKDCWFLVEWNLSEPNIDGTGICVWNKQLFGLYSLNLQRFPVFRLYLKFGLRRISVSFSDLLDMFYCSWWYEHSNILVSRSRIVDPFEYKIMRFYYNLHRRNTVVHLLIRPLPSKATPLKKPLMPKATPLIRPLPPKASPLKKPLPQQATPLIRALPPKAAPFIKPIMPKATLLIRQLPQQATSLIRPHFRRTDIVKRQLIWFPQDKSLTIRCHFFITALQKGWFYQRGTTLYLKLTLLTLAVLIIILFAIYNILT